MDPDKPALAPPPGVQSNFDNPPNGNVEAHIGIAICIFIVFVGASLRAYSKIVCMKQVKLEDYVGLVALAPYIAFVYGVYNLMRTVGIYVHQWDVRASEIPSALYIVYVNTSLFQATMGTIKAAILLEWIQLFVPRGTRTPFWWTCQIVMWVNILYYISIVTASALSCFPHEKIWHPTMPGRCFNTKALFVINATLNLVSDIIILILPQRIIWGLKMSTQKKIGVSLVFAVGVIATLVGGARLSRAVIYYLSNDNLYNVSAVFLWCTAELSTSFLVFCLPAIPKIFSSDNWFTQLASRLHSRLSFLKTRTTDTSGTNPKASTWKSSTFSGVSTSETRWDQQPQLSYEQHGFVSYYAATDPFTPNAIKSYVHYDTNPQASWPSVPNAALSRRDPSTSWYEEER
ncbi:hypothetical protein F5B22DRAFT_558869 [Xylaria bambusicola]|uniref:uncharacterized protein n=1 Tax=Xylaria bambusicola TaxID=326684 RepID=UPI0020087ED0|nr:uncharacterized protein F5B22DRAFT_558869 [Xylaria bambusicola]KAI0503245.1 hypothetical protein F5B22DRAFT_558869 [Xylaria bambusicola]